MKANPLMPDRSISDKIYSLRGTNVMIDSDLASLYNVDTKRLNEQVKRNSNRFPEDFMFQLTNSEWISLKSQIATSSWGGRRSLPYAFTEHGVLMLSSVLNSDQAIALNIHIVRVFNKLRNALFSQKDLLIKMNELESRVSNHDESIKLIFAHLKQFIDQRKAANKPIGFKQKGK